MDDTDVNRDLRLLTDVCPMSLKNRLLCSFPGLWLLMQKPWLMLGGRPPRQWSFGDGCGHPAGWLDSKSDCVMDEIVLDPEISRHSCR